MSFSTLRFSDGFHEIAYFTSTTSENVAFLYLRYNLSILYVRENNLLEDLQVWQFFNGMWNKLPDPLVRFEMFALARKKQMKICLFNTYSCPYKEHHGLLIQDYALPANPKRNPDRFHLLLRPMPVMVDAQGVHYLISWTERKNNSKCLLTRIDNIEKEIPLTTKDGYELLECNNVRYHEKHILLPSTRRCDIDGCVCRNTSFLALCHKCGTIIHACPYRCSNCLSGNKSTYHRTKIFLQRDIAKHIRVYNHTGPYQPRYAIEEVDLEKNKQIIDSFQNTTFENGG